jgi:multiple sugar transport system substrate-binding protein
MSRNWRIRCPGRVPATQRRRHVHGGTSAGGAARGAQPGGGRLRRGRGGGDEQPQAGQSGGEISGTLSTFGFSLPDEIATTRVDTFKKAYPKVQVKITEGGFDEQQFLSAVASGDPPDLVYVDREIIGTYAARGAIQPLDDCVSSAKIDMSQYRPAAVQQVTVDGKVYGIPEFYSVRVMMINSQAVKEAGLKPADVDTSDWSKLAGMARQLTVTKGDNLQRIGFDPKIPEFLPMWVRANGGAMLSDDGKTAQLNDPKVVEALTATAGIVQASGGWDRLKSLATASTSSGPRTSSSRTSWAPSRWRTGTSTSWPRPRPTSTSR